MSFDDLAELVSDVYDDPRRSAVKFGCDCGCGGDYFTEQTWVEAIEKAEKAKNILVTIGVKFDPID